MKFSQSAIALTAALSLLCTPAAAQTFSSCNPRFTTCPADPALGRSISVDFTKGAVDSFQGVGAPTYASDGVYFTVHSSGDAPQLVSRFYIMFGKVSITMKAAPGAGIVSSLVLQSDTLDEIDFEWLGAAPNEVQSNYFGKGDVTTYNRGAFHQTPENQQQWITYDVEWTATNIIWSVGGSVVRVLTPASADANQYPQTPMQIKFGSWSGGDSANPEGTIAWARGPTNYGNGPFSMIVKSISISDYSTGTSYEYRGNSGNMGDIVAIDGAVGAIQGTTASTPSAAPSVSSVSPSVPAGIGASQTGWPYHVQSTLTTATPSPTITIAGVPSGWVVAANGKIVPAHSAAIGQVLLEPRILVPSPLLRRVYVTGCETLEEWNQQGLPTTVPRPVGWATWTRTYNELGSSITPTCVPAVQTGASVQTVSAVQTGPSDAENGRIGQPHGGNAQDRLNSWGEVGVVRRVYIACFVAAAAGMCLLGGGGFL